MTCGKMLCVLTCGLSRVLLTTPKNTVWEEKNSEKYGGVRMRLNVLLECTECKRRNYSVSKNKKNTPERIELKKYCKFDKKATVHKEVKK